MAILHSQSSLLRRGEMLSLKSVHSDGFLDSKQIPLPFLCALGLNVWKYVS